MLRKICLLLLCIFAYTSFANANVFDKYNFISHKQCVSERWGFICCEGPYRWYYDKETVECRNKYNPFGDKIVELWMLRHSQSHAGVYDKNSRKINYQINLDDMTYKVLGDNDSKIQAIVPESYIEKLIPILKKIYEEDEKK